MSNLKQNLICFKSPRQNDDNISQIGHIIIFITITANETYLKHTGVNAVIKLFL